MQRRRQLFQNPISGNSGFKGTVAGTYSLLTEMLMPAG